jgi:GT2 family glycosyltransferase
MIEADLVFVMAVFRRDLFERLGGFREDLRYTEDYDFWLRAFASGARHVFTPQPLGVHVRSATSKSSNVEAHASVVRRVLQDLSASSQLNGNEQRAMVRALHAVDMRIERVRLERRIKGGDFAGARRTYYRTKAAYISSRKYWAGLCVITLSPRLYASLISGR